MSQDTVTDEVDVVESGMDPGVDAGTREEGETSLGLDENVASAVAYLFGFLSGLVVFLLEKDNQRVRFHAAQSMVLSVAIVGVSVALGIFGVLVDVLLPNVAGFLVGLVVSLGTFGISIVAFLFWVYLLVRTFQGANVRVPVVAGVADGLVD